MRDFTKWPRLIVSGKPVTREQANEILIRTGGYHFHTNDKAWERAVAGLFGWKYITRTTGDGHKWEDLDWQAAMESYKALGGLDLHYLHNSRIASSWIGGPKGWCDWDGNIACRNYNIGKWPTAEEVTEDWQAIAAAFPYLELRAQAITDEGEGEIAAEWAVAGGRAALVEPVGLIGPPEDILADEGAFITQFFGADRERGVTLERLAEALDQVRGQAQ